MYTGDLAGAERSYLEAIDMTSALLGEDHPEVATARENLGNVYFRSGQLDKTAKNLEVVLAMRRKAFGDDSEPVARTLANIGTVYLRAANDEASVTNYREAVEPTVDRSSAPSILDVGIALYGHGKIAARARQVPEAEVAFKRALDIYVKALGADNVATQRVIKALADSVHQVEEARGGGRVHGETEAGRGRGASRRGEVGAEATAIEKPSRRRRQGRGEVALACPRVTSPQVNTRPLHRVGLGLAQDFAGHRRRVAFAEGEELQQISDGIAFGPAEVRVRDGPGFVADI